MIKNLCWELLDHDLVSDGIHLGQQAEPAQPGRSQDHRVDLALSYSLDPGLDIPPNRHDFQPKVTASSPVEDLHRAPRSSGTDPGAVGQIIESPPHQHVSGVLARGDRDDLQIICRRSRQVLE